MAGWDIFTVIRTLEQVGHQAVATSPPEASSREHTIGSSDMEWTSPVRRSGAYSITARGMVALSETSSAEAEAARLSIAAELRIGGRAGVGP
jgi:hypothetical protein